MKRFLIFLFLSFWAISFAQTDSLNTEERIISFHSDIVVNRKGGIQVSEHIKVYATGNTIRRGIFRTLPETRNLNNREQKVRYTDISVTKDGEKEDYHTETDNGNLVIYVGKKDVFLTPAVYDYVINYSTENQIGFFKNYDEFYWNVNGLNWDFNTENISADIKLPEGAKIIQNSCYTGQYGEKGQNCTYEKVSDNEMTFSAKDFTNNEGLTIAVGFEKGLILPPPPPTFLGKYGILGASTVFLVGLFVFFFNSWDQYGRDPDSPTVYPQFNPPNDLSPASFGYIKKERFDTSLITASVVNLAIKGFLKITEKEDKGIFGLSKSKIYTLTKLKESDNTLPAEEQKLIEKLFKKGDSVTLDNKYDSSIKSMVGQVSANLSFQHDTFLNKGNNQKLLIYPALAVLGFYILGLIISFLLDPDFGKVILGGIIFVALLLAFFIGQFFGKFKVYSKLFWIIPFVLLIISFFGFKVGFASYDKNYIFCYSFLVFAFAGMMVYSYLIRKPTIEKLEEDSLIEGFEMYLSAAENQLIKFHNPPQMTPQIFEKYLPYAMVLGVDDIWGKKFENALKSMDTPYQNNWYIGGSINNMMFASAFSSSMTNSLSTAATPPSSSGSGSGGGGFSGGGGGGGGGGGW